MLEDSAKRGVIFLLLTLLFLWGSALLLGQFIRRDSVPEFSFAPLSMRPGTAESILFGGTINLNTAQKRDLLVLPGVGEGMAERILQSREHDGSFHSPNDLRRVAGIGAKKLAQILIFLR